MAMFDSVWDRTLIELKVTRRAMVGSSWEMALESRPPTVQIAAVKTPLNPGKAIRVLEDAGATECGDGLKRNESDLSAGIADLARARAASSMVEEVLAEADRVLLPVAEGGGVPAHLTGPGRGTQSGCLRASTAKAAPSTDGPQRPSWRGGGAFLGEERC